MAEQKPKRPAPENWATYWFAQFESALSEGNYAAAAQATAELRRLGYDVRRGQRA